MADININTVKSLLESLGYTLQDNDDWLIDFCTQKVQNDIRNSCNTNDVPEGLLDVAIGITAGEFLLVKKGSGQLQGFEVDLSAVAKQIQEGDTSVSFALDGSKTPEQRLDTLIAYLINKKETFVNYRCVKW